MFTVARHKAGKSSAGEARGVSTNGPSRNVCGISKKSGPIMIFEDCRKRKYLQIPKADLIPQLSILRQCLLVGMHVKKAFMEIAFMVLG